MKYRLSRCVHFLKANNEDKYIVYNNMNFKVIEGTLDDYEFLKKFQEPCEVGENSNKSIEYFISNKFLVEENENEYLARDQKIEEYRHEAKHNEDRRIKFMRISLTENCNLRCKYCFVNNIVKEKSTLSTEQFIPMVEYLISNNEHPRIQYFGGEPLMKMDLIMIGHEMLERARTEGRIKSYTEDIVTNGILLDDKKMDYFIKNNMQLIFSIDGWKKIHDENRIDALGNGTFDLVISKIEAFRNKGGHAYAIITPNKENLDVLDEVIKHLVNEYDFKDISINAPQPGSDGWEIDGKIFASKIQKIFDFCETNNIQLSAPGLNLIYNLYNNKYQIYSCTNYSLGINQEWGLYALSSGKISYCLVECHEKCTTDFHQSMINEKMTCWHLNNNRMETCKNCLAYSVCNGPCSIERVLLKDKTDTNKCKFNSEMVRWGLLK